MSLDLIVSQTPPARPLNAKGRSKRGGEKRSHSPESGNATEDSSWGSLFEVPGTVGCRAGTKCFASRLFMAHLGLHCSSSLEKKKEPSLGKDLQAFYEKAVSALRGKTRVFSFWLCVVEERTESADGSVVRVSK